MLNKTQIDSNTSLLDFYSQLANSLIISEQFKKCLIWFQILLTQAGLPCIAEPKWEGMSCSFENKMFTKTSV